MKVKELIKILETLDPELKVICNGEKDSVCIIQKTEILNFSDGNPESTKPYCNINTKAWREHCSIEGDRDGIE